MCCISVGIAGSGEHCCPEKTSGHGISTCRWVWLHRLKAAHGGRAERFAKGIPQQAGAVSRAFGTQACGSDVCAACGSGVCAEANAQMSRCGLSCCGAAAFACQVVAAVSKTDGEDR